MAVSVLRVLFLNTYLLRVFEAEIASRSLRVASKPRVAERARELGRLLPGAYDVIALAEVFDERDLDSILSGWSTLPRPRAAVGPVSSSPFVLASSGLATIVDGPQLGRVAASAYTSRGDRLHDADAWAEKGALMCEIEVGGATVEITSTHLLAGGGLLPRLPPPAGRRSTDRDRATRASQLVELRRFIDEHHVDGNLQLVVGDLNVPAGDSTGGSTDEYDDLIEVLDGLDDLWLRPGGGVGRRHGPTSEVDESRPEFRPDPSDPRFYDDAAADPPERSARIDYAFGSPTLRVRTMRRRRLPRPADAPGRDEIELLSDHVGLHIELEVDAID